MLITERVSPPGYNRGIVRLVHTDKSEIKHKKKEITLALVNKYIELYQPILDNLINGEYTNLEQLAFLINKTQSTFENTDEFTSWINVGFKFNKERLISTVSISIGQANKNLYMEFRRLYTIINNLPTSQNSLDIALKNGFSTLNTILKKAKLPLVETEFTNTPVPHGHWKLPT